jgi:hypothetical protein
VQVANTRQHAHIKGHEVMRDELLFNEHEMYGVVEGQKRAVIERVMSIPPNALLNTSEYDLIHSIMKAFRLNVPIIKDDEIHIAESVETQVGAALLDSRLNYNTAMK